MATKPLKPCRFPGCFVLVSGGYCAAHKPAPALRSKAAQSYRRLYSTALWTRLRSEQLLREPWCRECARHGIRTRATDVDHIRDHKGDAALFADAGNLQSLCHSCHSRKTASEMAKTQEFDSNLGRENGERLGVQVGASARGWIPCTPPPPV